MRTSTLRKTILLALIGLSTQQTSSWGEPFTVDNSAITTPGASTDNPVPQPTVTSSRGQPFTVGSSSQGGLQVDSVTPTPSDLARTSSGTGISGLQTQVSRGSTFDASATASSAASRTASASGSAQSTGAAVAVSVVGYKKMGFVGAVAGAAGLIFV